MSSGAAVFDFDKTLVHQETLALFLRAVAGRGACLSACCVAGVKAAKVSAEKRMPVFRAELLKRTLAGKTLSQVNAAAEQVFEKLKWNGWVNSELASHQNAGRKVIVATGSLSVYMPVLLRCKGIAVDDLLSTEMAIDGNTLTGEMVTPSCTWEEKAMRVKSWLINVEGPVWGYGNMPHDGAMLDLTDFPSVVQHRQVTRG
jgi:phosphatidylglycerophosphatase C